MSILTILYTILIMPLQIFYEVVFSFAQRFTNDPGLSIIVLSLVVNFLVLPLYRRADAIQAEQRDIEKRMAPGIRQIKKTFSGDEKLMMLQAYYKENNYKPTDVFKESISLLLQIPFFTAAYRFLSNLALLDESSLGPIKDLGQPDGLITIGAITLNLLPILMTAINIVSGAIYTKGLPIKAKVQLYGMAALFLVLLYSSPAGLLFYWTLNNLFSLIKNIFFKLKNPQKVLSILASLAGIVLVIYSLFFFENTLKRRVIAIGIGILLQLPFVITLLKKQKINRKFPKTTIPNPMPKLFLGSGIFLTILIGGLIPSAVIKASPQEFINIAAYTDPLWNVVYAVCLAFGTFVVWMGVFYLIADDTGKHILENIMWISCGVAVVDYMFFGTDLGILFATLQFERDPSYSMKTLIINAAVILIVITAMFLIPKRFHDKLSWVLSAAITGLVIMLLINVVYTERDLKPVKERLHAGAATSEAAEYDVGIHFNLSKEGKNVILLMIDRAMGPFIPYIMNEKPELEEQFDGFTYYSNSISFGGFTNFGTPAIYGGYEYSPAEINKRDKETLKDKQNEALKVLPVLFNSNGYEVTVCDPTYANYNWISDTSIYDEYPGINAYNTKGMFQSVDSEENQRRLRRNFYLYGIMKTVPLFMQRYVYNAGYYNYLPVRGDEPVIQTTEGTSKASGIKSKFMDEYLILQNMDSLTRVTDEDKNTFLMMSNSMPHEPILLQEPEYEPRREVDNEAFDRDHTDRFNVNGRQMEMENVDQYASYETNMAAMIILGRWFDYLRDNDVYDNTRIILVSDHGRGLEQFEELKSDIDDMERFTHLLMVKDFDSHGFTTSDQFMTTGDAAVSAVEGVIEDPVNPFTGKKLDNKEKTAHDQYVTASYDWDTLENSGNQFLPSDWYAVHDNVWEKSNWRKVAENAVFTGDE